MPTAKKTPAKKTAAPAGKPRAKKSPDDERIEKVPVELQFSSDSGQVRVPETMDIVIDGQLFTLTQPSDTLLHLLAGSFASTAEVGEQIRAMMELVNVCLSPDGQLYLRRLITSSANDFDDGLLGSLTATILNTWAPKLAENSDLEAKPANRAQRRQAARSVE